MRWPWRRGRQREEAAAPAAFDALIDLDGGRLPPGMAHETAVAVATRAAGQVAGASWISVEVHRQGVDVAARVFPAASSQVPAGEPWSDLVAAVEAAVRAALAAARGGAVEGGGETDTAEAGCWPAAAAMPTGFAETMSPAQADALAALASLAEASQGRRPGRRPAKAAAPEPAEAAPATQQDALDALAALARATRLAPPAPVPDPAPAPPVSLDADAGALARLLGFVLPADGRAVAAAAVRRFGSFAAVLAAPEAELRQVQGLGTHSVAAIKLVHAAAVRLARAEASRQPVLDDPRRLFAYLSAALARERIEQFRILFLDGHGMLRADEVQARGTINHTPVYPREVVRRALELGAASIVLVHNHPSGNPEPSRDDIEMTRLVREAAGVMSVVVRDHVIVGNGRWLSFREAGLLG